MSAPASGPQGARIGVIWPGVDDMVVPVANMFLAQLGPSGVDGEMDLPTITVGQAMPPVITGTVEEQQALMRAVGAVPVRTLARFSLTRSRVTELIATLQTLVQQYDQAAENLRQNGPE